MLQSKRSERLWNAVVRRAEWTAILVFAGLCLCAVALLNGGPIYYPDTGAYLLDADRLIHFRAPFAVRPVFYGLAILPFHWGAFFFPALFAQALIVGHVIYLVMRCCFSDLRPAAFIGVISVLVLLSPISFHVSHLLPDVFVGVFILVMFLLAMCRDQLSKGEVLYLLGLGIAAASFHLTAIPVGIALGLLYLLFSFSVFSFQRFLSSLVAFAPVTLALTFSLLFSVVVFHRLTLIPKNPPHLLARLLADGPGRDFLRQACPQVRFILCDYQDRLTSVEDDFLWRFLPGISPADAFRIKAEQAKIIEGTVSTFPGAVAEHMLRNTMRQLASFQSETQVSQAEWNDFQASGTQLARSLAHSLQGRRGLERPALDTINTIHFWVVIFSLVSTLSLTGLAFRANLFRPVALSMTVLSGLLVNAFVCGAFGGVFARYEGRVIWLLPLSAMVTALALLQAKRTRPLISRLVRVFSQKAE